MSDKPKKEMTEAQTTVLHVVWDLTRNLVDQVRMRDEGYPVGQIDLVGEDIDD